jgi:hypothetical protein
MEQQLSFRQALRKMPEGVRGNFDALAYTTIEDLAYCAEHELDLFYEGEYNDFKSKRVVAAAEKYVLLLTGKTYRERLQGLGTK